MPRYLHGVYGSLASGAAQSVDAVYGLPVYIVRAPLHLLSRYEGRVNEPTLVRNFEDGVRLLGYCEDWESFEFCQVLYAHFRGRYGATGPIVVIPVLDPATMRDETSQTQNVTMRAGRGEFADPLCIISSAKITGKVAGTDYEVSWDAQRGMVVVRDLSGELGASVSLTYERVKPDDVTEAAVIGDADTDTGKFTGVRAVALVRQALNVIPSVLAAPGWSQHAAVDAALKTASQQPEEGLFACVSSDTALAESTIAGAIQAKLTDEHIGEEEAPCWPMMRSGNRFFHISTLAVVAMMQTDAANGGIPFETPSNKPVDVTGFYVPAATEEKKYPRFMQAQVNRLNEAGIRTCNHFGGRWVLWGAHTGAVGIEGQEPGRALYDSNMRMLYYILNWIHVTYAARIDKPMYLNTLDSIEKEIGEYIDGLISSGALIYGKVEFANAALEGDLVKVVLADISLLATPTPPMSALRAQVQYTDEGIRLLTGGIEG